MTHAGERVARALSKKCPLCKSEENWRGCAGFHLSDAKAAFKAMREPTEEMLKDSLNYTENHGPYSNIKARYQAMIDAALK